MALPAEIIDYLLASAHGGHGAKPAAGAVPKRGALPPEAVTPEDFAGLDTALQADREAAASNSLGSNLSRAASIYRGNHNPGPIAGPVPTEMRDWMLKRGLRAEDAAARTNAEATATAKAKADRDNAPAPPEWGAPPGFNTAEAREWLGKKHYPKEAPVDPLLDPKRAKLEAETKRLTEPKEKKSADGPRTKADADEMTKRGLNPDLAQTHGEALHLVANHDAAKLKERQVETGEKKVEQGGAKIKMLSDAQEKQIAEYDKGVDLLKWILDQKKAINTGPGASAQNRMGQFVGMDDAKVSAFRAAVGDNLAMYIRSLSGAAVSDKERAVLVQNMPKFDDADAVFVAKANKVIERLKKLRDVELQGYKKQGKDTSKFEAGASTSDGAGKPAADPLGIR